MVSYGIPHSLSTRVEIHAKFQKRKQRFKIYIFFKNFKILFLFFRVESRERNLEGEWLKNETS